MPSLAWALTGIVAASDRGAASCPGQRERERERAEGAVQMEDHPRQGSNETFMVLRWPPGKTGQKMKPETLLRY